MGKLNKTKAKQKDLPCLPFFSSFVSRYVASFRDFRVTPKSSNLGIRPSTITDSVRRSLPTIRCLSPVD